MPLVAEAVGPVDGVRPLGGAVWRCRAAGRDVVVKEAAGAGDEAAGLRALASVAGAPPTPEVVHVADELLVTTCVDEGTRDGKAEEALGRALARLHHTPWATWGGGSSWIGQCRVDPAEHTDATTFYTARLTELAAACGLDAVVAPVVARLPALLPDGAPALLHGDLWWGNVRWGADGRGWLIDPAAHGGHPEEDLAMLALFGGVPDRLLAAYQEQRPLAAGWEERVELFQLVPLLVHATLFGGGYRSGVERAANRYS